jgi:hypothetical protein
LLRRLSSPWRFLAGAAGQAFAARLGGCVFAWRQDVEEGGIREKNEYTNGDREEQVAGKDKQALQGGSRISSCRPLLYRRTRQNQGLNAKNFYSRGLYGFMKS